MTAPSPPSTGTDVTLFFRQPRPEYHSLEQLFDCLLTGLRQEQPTVAVRKAVCPHSRVSLRNLWRNVRFARRNRGAVNHITGDVHYLALGLPARQTILTIHDCVLLTRYPKTHPMYWFYYYLWYKWPTDRAAVVTTISEKSKEELVHRIGVRSEKVIVIPNFYDPVFDDSTDLFQSNTPKPIVLQIGTGPNKNLERVIDALAGLNCRLAIIGDVSDAQRQRLTRSGLDYTTASNLSRADLRARYAAADVIVFASTYEGFGLPILEAQAMGRPIITSNLSPMREVAGAGTILVDPQSTASIREAVQGLLNDPARRADLVERGRQNVTRYGLTRTLTAYWEQYNRITDGYVKP